MLAPTYLQVDPKDLKNEYEPLFGKSEREKKTLINHKGHKINKVIPLLHISNFLDRGCRKSIHPSVFEYCSEMAI
jgi:hypothetical protein